MVAQLATSVGGARLVGSVVWRWLASTDTRAIALRFQVGTMALYLVGAVLAVLVRIEHLSARPTILMPGAFYRVLTLHGLIMLFWVTLPAMSAGLGVARLPALLGTERLVWPRLVRAGFHAWLVGTGCLVGSVASGAPDGGIVLRPPLSTAEGWASPLAALGMAAVMASSTALAVSLLATIWRNRPRDGSWLDWPLMLTSLECSAALTVLVAPVLTLTMLLLVLGRAAGIGPFESTHGGSPGLYAGLFWLSLRPAVTAALLPAFGIVDELLPVLTGRPLVGRRAVTVAVAALGGLSLASGGEHLLTGGQGALAAAVFSAFGMLLALPLGVIAMALALSLGGTRLEWEAPLVHLVGMAWFLLLGLLSGFVASAMSVNVHLHGTVFVVAHLHCLGLGAMTSAWFAGLIFWWPDHHERTPDPRLVRAGAMLTFLGSNFVVLPLFVLGARGLVRGSYEYAEEFRALEIVSTVGSWVFSSGLVTTLYSLVSTWQRPREPGVSIPLNRGQESIEVPASDPEPSTEPS
jgi:cytochrome c oxidase subunit I